MVNFDLPINCKENESFIYGITYFYTVLLASLIWSIWRFINALLSLKPKNIKKSVERRLAHHCAERRRYRLRNSAAAPQIQTNEKIATKL